MSALPIPALCLVALIGVSGSGKTTFARRHFGPYEVLSSDTCRGLVSNDENDQSATAAAFDVLQYIAGRRLQAGLLTVVDATSVQPEARRALIDLAKAHDVLPVAIVLDVDEAICLRRNASRPDRDFGAHVVRRQHQALRRSLRGLGREGFRTVHVLRGVDEIDAATIERQRLFNDLRHEQGPFDVVGDVHGCLAELEELLWTLGYELARDAQGRAVDAVSPQGRRVVFLGDLVDRGPDTPGVLRLAMGMVRNGHALAVPGNHEHKLVRALSGHKVGTSHGLAETIEQLSHEPAEFREQVVTFCRDLVSHLVLDGGRLVVAHAGLKEAYHGRTSARVRSFALYGDTTGETDEFGLPVRYPWANDYRGSAMVLYGHTPIPVPEWTNNTMCLDTGCVFGGRLTALRYPERTIVSVAAQRVWYQPVRPLAPEPEQPQREGDVLRISDVLGRRTVETRWHGRVSVTEDAAYGALEVMSRFALHPGWLPYLPPTMAPCGTSARPDLLEHPDEAFAGYRAEGVQTLVCEEKHMGSRAVIVLCREAAAARQRFAGNATGALYTRTGRPFFDPELAEAVLSRLRAAATTAGLWDELGTPWLLLDAELMPWSAKAQDLLRHQYAAVGAAARAALPAAIEALESARTAGIDVEDVLRVTRERAANAQAFVAAYRRYCWPTDGIDGLRLAPFQLLATQGATHHHRDHAWHLAIADRLADAAPDLIARTARISVDLSDDASTSAAVRWWEALTASGGEGMVVKPLSNLPPVEDGARPRRLPQPAVKVRGREYLRIVYGPDYTLPGNLDRLRQRGLGRKRSQALREYALGIEALERLARDEPLWRVHEAVFAVLALQSEPTDPRL